VLESSFIAEVKSDLMGEQTILCGMLQTGALLCFDKMVEKGIDWATRASWCSTAGRPSPKALKHGGITLMMDRLSNPAKIKAFELSEELRAFCARCSKAQDDIMTGEFSHTMMADWDNDDKPTCWAGAPPPRDGVREDPGPARTSPSRSTSTTAS
jgi:ketol-acid reductoisomerase